MTAERSRLGALRRAVFERFPRVSGVLVRIVARVIPFEVWERHGFHLTQNNFYSPIPDTPSLPEDLWERRTELLGVDLRPDIQVALVRGLVERFGDELAAIPLDGSEPGAFQLRNDNFEGLDAQIAYCLIRDLKPRRVIEVGSGWSSLVIADAIARNASEGSPASITCVEPYPRPFFRDAVALRADLELLQMPVQDVPLDRFRSLEAGDVLFIDSSHTVRIGGDVPHEFLEILPRLAPGVVVHVHDIFLPWEYPREWVEEKRRYWAEQYVVQAFLAYNTEFEVVWASQLMAREHGGLLAGLLPQYDPARGHGSLWLRRYR